MSPRSLISVFVLLMACLGWAPDGWPDDSNAAGLPPLRLSSLVELALDQNPEIRAMRDRWEGAKAEIPQARSLEDPQLSLTQWSIPSNFDLTDADETWIGIGQSIPFPGKRSLRGEIAARAADSAEQDYRAKVREVTASVKSAFYRLFAAHKSIELHREHQALLEEFIAGVEQKYAVGQASQQDLLKAQVEFSKLHNSLMVLEQEKVSAEAEIHRLLDTAATDPLGHPEEPDYAPFPLTLEELTDRAVLERPELKAIGFMIRQHEQAKALARKNYLPDMMIELMYWDVRSGPNRWMAAGKINLPWIFTGKYRARDRQAAAEENQARSEYAAVRNQTLFLLRDLFTKIRTAGHLIETYRGTVLPLAEQSLDSARIGYQAGKTEFLNVIDSERTLLDLHLEYYGAMVQYGQSMAELERVMGSDIDIQS